MRFLIHSDIHLSHWRGGAAAFFSSFDMPDLGEFDATLLGGDFGNPIMEAAEEIARHYVRGGKRVLYANGNHDDYRGLRGSKYEFTFHEEQQALFREFAAQNGITILDRDSGPVVVDGVRIVGCTGWPEFAAELVPPGMTKVDAMSASQKGWWGDNIFDRVGKHNDFAEIRVGKGNGRHVLTPSQMIAWAKLDNEFLRETLAQPFDGDTVVVTHVGPASLVTPGMHAWMYGSRANEDAICDPAAGVTAWISGHTHKTFDLELAGGVRAISNARGHPGENPSFDPTLIVEVGRDLTPTLGM